MGVMGPQKFVEGVYQIAKHFAMNVKIASALQKINEIFYMGIVCFAVEHNFKGACEPSNSFSRGTTIASDTLQQRYALTKKYC